ncbi:MAG: sulfite reductase [Verrucomicrobia bacterium]|nr:sulfite reductase [Verrucomicrobiota bacterium]
MNESPPFYATIKEQRRLSSPHSSKRTHHFELCLKNSGLTYRTGDCVKIHPTNSVEAVEHCLKRLGASGEEHIEIKGTSWKLFDFLHTQANLKRPPRSLEGNLSDTCAKFGKLMPRFYSIASAMEEVGQEVHLTVRYLDEGVCSQYLCEQAQIGSTVPISIYPCDHFKLPEDPHQPIIMIGPGTGVAPFRGFLQERIAKGAPGKNWLFFGEWTQEGHFFYQEFWQHLQKRGQLQLDLAFSRDQIHKIYVQDRIKEKGDLLWHWLQEGAVLYLCGDAKAMAPAVEKVLFEVCGRHLPPEEVIPYFKQLKEANRYQKDVY